jgi:hypothetical protein
MTRQLRARWRFVLLLVVLALELAPFASQLSPQVALAQDVTADPQAVSPAATDLRTGFQFVPEKSEQREPVPGITVYEADFVRDQTPTNFANGPIEIKSLVAKTANSQQAAEQFTSSRQALTTASPAWVESKVAKLGDEATGLTMEGQSSDGSPAVAHLFLFRRGAMVVGITVAGLTKPTKMAEAESIAAVVLRKIDPSAKSQTGPKQARQLNTKKPPSTNSGTSTAASTGSSPSPSTASASTAGSTGQKVRVANTGGTGVRLRVDPSKTARVAGVLPDGTMLDIVGPDKQAEGLTWRNVRAPGDGRGWVASDYVAAVAGSPSANSATQASAAPAPAASPTPSPTTASASTAAATTTGSTSSPPATTPATSPATSPSASASGDVLKVDVNVKNAKVKAGGDQSVDIVVSKNGQPLSGAQVTIKTSPTGETPSAGATDASGKVTVNWKPTGSPGFIGVGVSALGADGSAGVGGASFEITN